jgi:hypothetical protein
MSAEREERDPLVMIRLMQVGAALTNQALSRYVTHPGSIKEISAILAGAFKTLGEPIAVGGTGEPCQQGYCRSGNLCVPCETRYPKDPGHGSSDDQRVRTLQAAIQALAEWRDSVS